MGECSITSRAYGMVCGCDSCRNPEMCVYAPPIAPPDATCGYTTAAGHRLDFNPLRDAGTWLGKSEATGANSSLVAFTMCGAARASAAGTTRAAAAADCMSDDFVALAWQSNAFGCSTLALWEPTVSPHSFLFPFCFTPALILVLFLLFRSFHIGEPSCVERDGWRRAPSALERRRVPGRH